MVTKMETYCFFNSIKKCGPRMSLELTIVSKLYSTKDTELYADKASFVYK